MRPNTRLLLEGRQEHPIPEGHRKALKGAALATVTAHLFRTGDRYQPLDFDAEYHRLYGGAKALESELTDLNGEAWDVEEEHRHERDDAKAGAILDRLSAIRRRQAELGRRIAHAHWDAEDRRQAVLGGKVAPDMGREPE